MTVMRPALCAAALLAMSAAAASVTPAYVISTVNLRAGPSTSNDIVDKIPGGSLVDATDCANGWCSVAWQGKSGFAIQTALDTSGRVPRRAGVAVGAADGYVPMGGPVYYGPPAYYYGGPYYYGYGPYWGWRGGYGRGYYRGYRGRWHR